MVWPQLAHATVLKTFDTIVLRTVDGSGADCVVKLYRPHRAAELERLTGIGRYLNTVQAHYPQLQLQTLLYQHPQLVDYGLLKGGESDPRLLVAYPWIKGMPPQRKTAALLEQIGQVLGMLHNVSEVFAEKPPLLHLDHHFFESVLVLVASHPAFSEVPTAQQEAFRQNMGALVEHMAGADYSSAAYGIIHSDLHFANWLRHHRKLTPIDFDEAAYGHYLTDLAVVLMEIETNLPPARWATCQQNLLDGYQKHRKLRENQLNDIELNKLTVSALYLNWAFGMQSADIFAQKSKKNLALAAIERIAESNLAKKLGKRI